MAIAVRLFAVTTATLFALPPPVSAHDGMVTQQDAPVLPEILISSEKRMDYHCDEMDCAFVEGHPLDKIDLRFQQVNVLSTSIMATHPGIPCLVTAAHVEPFPSRKKK